MVCFNRFVLQCCASMVCINRFVLQCCASMVCTNGVLQCRASMVCFNGVLQQLVLQCCASMVCTNGVLQCCASMLCTNRVFQSRLGSIWLNRVLQSRASIALAWFETLWRPKIETTSLIDARLLGINHPFVHPIGAYQLMHTRVVDATLTPRPITTYRAPIWALWGSL